MGVTFKVQSPVSTGLFYARIGLKGASKKLGAKFALLLNFHLKPPSYIITRREL
jgi:hypothetical protein